jgi:two-component system sensor histidine kinase UhpB
VTIKGVNYGRIAIISNPVDELAEVWSDVSWLALVGLLVTSISLGLVLLLVRGSLKPFEGLKRGLSDLEAGKSNVRIEVRGATEFRVISAALNSLAETLDRMRIENRALVDRLIRVQDDERKEIARDLHDEAGPCLFSIRAGAVALSESTATATLDIPRIRQTCANVNKASEVLQNLFRALLVRLAPRGLSEFGLREVLQRLLNSWQTSRPDVALELICPHDLSILDESISLTAFRVVQESITNIFRHANANSARIRVELGSTGPSSSSEIEAECAPALLITIEDNGVGIPTQPTLGLGLMGMRERVQALGGSISMDRRAIGGTRIAVSLPLPNDDEDEP